MTDIDRRTFLRGAALSTAGLAIATRASATEPTPEETILGGKTGLRVHSERPVVLETPTTLLDGDTTPNHQHFVCNHGLVPPRAVLRDTADWTLTVDGEVDRPTPFTLEQLQSRFSAHTASLVIESAGNGRAGYRPAAQGTPWTLGGVGCATWRGVLLRDLLEGVDYRGACTHVAWEGEDRSLTGEGAPISRSIPIEKALDGHTMVAWAMNGEALPPEHGFPLRLVVPGYPGSASGKWLKRLWLRDQEHDGATMAGLQYRMPTRPLKPGGELDPAHTRIITEVPVKSMFTAPASGARVAAGESLQLRGQAWSGAGRIERVDLSWDFGQTWIAANLQEPPNPFAWQRFAKPITLPGPGYYELWARATDVRGATQPQVVPGWNPLGYLNNAMHRIAVEVTG